MNQQFIFIIERESDRACHVGYAGNAQIHIARMADHGVDVRTKHITDLTLRAVPIVIAVRREFEKRAIRADQIWYAVDFSQMIEAVERRLIASASDSLGNPLHYGDPVDVKNLSGRYVGKHVSGRLHIRLDKPSNDTVAVLARPQDVALAAYFPEAA